MAEGTETALSELKVPPHSIEAEQSVLGGLMLDNYSFDDVAERLSETDFYRHDHALIFQAVSVLADNNQPFDVVTLSESLQKLNQLDEAGGIAYLGELAKNTPSAYNIRAYADIVREHSILRQLIRVSNEIAESAFSAQGRKSDEILDTAERRVFAIAEQQTKEGGPRKIKPLLKETIERIDTLFSSDEALTGLTTGFIDLDNLTSGLQNGDLIIGAARPSMGKTTFALNIAENALLKTGKPVLAFSMEMPSDQLVMRMLSSLGRIDQSRLRNGRLEDDDWPRLTSAMTLLQDQKLMIDDTPGLSPLEVRARARRAMREFDGELGLIVIDYLQLMQAPGADNRVNEISQISRALKNLAKELNVPVLALSQLNRGLEQRPNKRPIMSDLRESGAIEQDADVIMFIYRDEVYNEDSQDQGKAEIIIGKQRNGPVDTVKLAFFGQYTKFEDLAPESYEGYA